MSARTVKSIFLVGCADLAYRMFLRGFVRRQVGMDAGLAHARIAPTGLTRLATIRRA